MLSQSARLPRRRRVILSSMMATMVMLKPEMAMRCVVPERSNACRSVAGMPARAPSRIPWRQRRVGPRQDFFHGGEKPLFHPVERAQDWLAAFARHKFHPRKCQQCLNAQPLQVPLVPRTIDALHCFQPPGYLPRHAVARRKPGR